MYIEQPDPGTLERQFERAMLQHESTKSTLKKIGPLEKIRARSEALLATCPPVCGHGSRPLACLVEDVVSHILDVVGAQALTEGPHGALTVGHLVLDGLHAH